MIVLLHVQLNRRLPPEPMVFVEPSMLARFVPLALILVTWAAIGTVHLMRKRPKTAAELTTNELLHSRAPREAGSWSASRTAPGRRWCEVAAGSRGADRKPGDRLHRAASPARDRDRPEPDWPEVRCRFSA